MKKLFIALALTAFASSAWSAGFQLRYMGAETMGTGLSSAGTYGHSASSLYYNPGLILTQDNDHIFGVDVMWINSTKDNFTSSNTGNSIDGFAKDKFTGGLYYGNKIDENSAFTLTLTTPWANSTDYPSNWEGRFHALETDLGAVNLQPVLTKRIGEKLLLSIGAQIQYLMGNLSTAIPAPPGASSGVEGDNVSAGGVLGLTYTPSESTTIALNYNSRIKHNLRGDLKAAGSTVSDDASLEITTPDVLTLGVSHDLSQKFIGHAALSYTHWSTFKQLNVLVSGTPISTPEAQNWDNVYLIALGGTYLLNENTTLRAGAFYETSAADNEHRTPRTQDAERLGLGLGTSFGLSSNLKMDIGLNHILYLEDITIDKVSPTPLKGDYDMSATLLRLGLNYIF